MILKSITMKNWGCFREEKHIKFEKGINLICGMNETGKSTTIDALRRAFFDKHGTQATEIKELQPWGSSLSPRVTVEFETAEGHYRIKKSFLVSPESTLSRQVDGSWHEIAEGDNADKEVIKVLGGEHPGRGASKPVHWGIAQALWSRQGEILPEDGFTEETQQRIQSVMGHIVPSEEGRKVENKITKLFGECWTESNRKPRTGSELLDLGKKIDEIRANVEGLNRSWVESDELRQNIHDMRMQMDKYHAELDCAKKELGEAKAAAVEAEKHRSAREKHEHEVERLRRDYDDIDKEIQNIESTRKKIGELEKRIAEYDDSIKHVDSDMKGLEHKEEELREERGKINESVAVSDEQLRSTRIAYDAVRDGIEIEELSEKLSKIGSLTKKMEARLKEYEGLTAPSSAELRDILEISKKIEEKKIKLKAIGLEATIAANTGLEGEIRLDGKSENIRMSNGEKSAWSAGNNVSLRIKDVVSVDVKSGSGDVNNLKKELEEIEEDYRAQTEPYATDVLEELEEMHSMKERLKSEVANYDERINDQITSRTFSFIETDGLCPFCDNSHRDGDPYKQERPFEKHVVECAEKGDPLTAMKESLKRKKKKVSSSWSRIKDVEELQKFKDMKDIEGARSKLTTIITRMESERDSKVGDVSEIEHGLDKIRELSQEKEETLIDLKSDRSECSGKLDSEREYLETLLKEGVELEERRVERKKIAKDLSMKEQALEVMLEEKEEKESAPLRAVEYKGQVVGELTEYINELDREISVMKGRMDELAKKGTYTELTKNTELLETLERKRDEVEKTAKAVELLYDLYRMRRKLTMSNLMHPLTERVSEDLKVISGRYENVTFKPEGMTPASVKPTGWDTEAGVHILSHGTQEQIALSVRLALGDILGEDEMQMVVLDDPLTNTDPLRFTKAIDILERYSSRLQIILITCNKSRYAGLDKSCIIEIN